MPSVEHFAWAEIPADSFQEMVRTMEREAIDLSMHPRWIEAIAAAHGVRSELHLAVARSETTASFLPYRKHRRIIYGLPLRLLSPASNLVAYHPEVIGTELAEFLIESLLTTPAQSWDLAEFRNLRPQGITAQAVQRVAARLGTPIESCVGESSPYISLEGGWSRLIAARSKKSRYNLKRIQRRLSELGGVEVQWYFGEEDIAPLLPAVLAVEAESRKVAAGMAISENPHETRYYEMLLPILVELRALAANVMTLDGRPIAYSLCYRWRDRWAQLKTSFVDEFSELSPGTAVNMLALQKACETGAKEFDFLGHVMPHKTMWTDLLRPHSGFFLYGRTPRGVVAHKLRRLVMTMRDRTRTG